MNIVEADHKLYFEKINTSLDLLCKNQIKTSFLKRASSLPRVKLLVASSNSSNDILGFMYYYQNGDIIYIELMCSKQSGVGSALIDHLKMHNTFKFITCEASWTAIDFYMKCGFYPVDTNGEYVAEDDTMQATYFSEEPENAAQLKETAQAFRYITAEFLRPLAKITANTYKKLRELDIKNPNHTPKIKKLKQLARKQDSHPENIIVMYFPQILAHPDKKGNILRQIRSDVFSVSTENTKQPTKVRSTYTKKSQTQKRNKTHKSA